MRDSNDKLTMQLLEMPKLRGRPVSGKAKSTAERQRIFRERKAQREKYAIEAAAISFANETDAELLTWLATSGPVLQEKAWLELGRRRGWKLP